MLARNLIVGALAAVPIVDAILVVARVGILFIALFRAERSHRVTGGLHVLLLKASRTCPKRAGWLLIYADFFAVDAGIANDPIVGGLGVASCGGESG